MSTPNTRDQLPEWVIVQADWILRKNLNVLEIAHVLLRIRAKALEEADVKRTLRLERYRDALRRLIAWNQMPLNEVGLDDALRAANAVLMESNE